MTDHKTDHAPSNADAPADKIKKAEWVTIAINAFIALVILWQAWTYHQQRKLMKRQIENANISERAYIGIDHMKLHRPLAANDLVDYRSIFINGGRTPAWAFRCHSRIIFTDEPITEVIQKYPVDPPSGTGAFIPAGQRKRVECYSDLLLDEARFNAITVAKTHRLFVLVKITFRDFLEVQREFPFRLTYNPDSKELEEADYDEEAN